MTVPAWDKTTETAEDVADEDEKGGKRRGKKKIIFPSFRNVRVDGPGPTDRREIVQSCLLRLVIKTGVGVGLSIHI